MARQTRRRTTGGLGEEAWLLLIALGLIALALLAWAALSAGSWCAGVPITAHPVAALLQVMAGRHPWPWQSSALFVFALAALGAFATTTRGRWAAMRRNDIDQAARTMVSPRQISAARQQDNATAAERLLKDAPADVRALPGPPLGRTVVGGIELFVPAEMGVFIAAGQRTGKTMAWAIPAVLSAWGPVLATSNKPDLYRHTTFGREQRGRVWLCDLQAVTGQAECGFWVDLLARIHTLAAARKLASFFVSGASGSASERANARVDSYFDGGAQELLALYILAAACVDGDLLHVAEWLSSDQDQTPILILRHHHHTRAAQRISDAQGLYARQRDGLYDMARRFLNVLSDEGYATMITPPARQRISVYETSDAIAIDTALAPKTHDLPEFKPAEFVTSNDTLFALSMTGPDSAAALTAALVGQILESALTVARARPEGRLAVPLLAVLDEAANCALIDALPSYYTYAAGCGVILLTIVQVLEQAEDLWGANGLTVIRAQSIEIYGGNIATPTYLEQWARLVDDHDVADYSRSTGPGGTNRTTSWRAEPILNVAKLARLPKDRALIRLPGHEPILIEKQFWWNNPTLEPLVTRSLARYTSPSKPPTRPDSHTGGAAGVEL
ncbi:type IV secretory system conjugative DNA transfer family protein [Nocardia veterana]|uniref:TraM recognition domain-containing protein n=1 Tax=Nocardia veterana TaxID=132249 RepID=A0A7X6LZS0_9NOCA|nr:TraM recognition domain-containing protein [Nocardia veterana]NKY87551.1 TraM recognition domain-containing protein [Nocardia veterana]